MFRAAMRLKSSVFYTAKCSTKCVREAARPTRAKTHRFQGRRVQFHWIHLPAFFLRPADRTPDDANTLLSILVSKPPFQSRLISMWALLYKPL